MPALRRREAQNTAVQAVKIHDIVVNEPKDEEGGKSKRPKAPALMAVVFHNVAVTEAGLQGGLEHRPSDGGRRQGVIPQSRVRSERSPRLVLVHQPCITLVSFSKVSALPIRKEMTGAK